MKKTKKLWKKILMFLFNPRLLLCFGIGWMITNGWSYILLAIGSFGDIRWMVDISLAYLTILWLPFTPKKIVTITIAIFLLKIIFPKDEKTLAVLKQFQTSIINRKKQKKKVGTTLKVLITYDWYLKKTNGVTASISVLIDELIKRGHEVRVLSLSSSGESYKDEATYYIGSKSFDSVYPGARRPLYRKHGYLDELVEWKPDIIHSQCEFYTFSYAKRISKKTGAPIIHTYHTLYDHYIHYLIKKKWLGERILHCFMKRRLKAVDKIIVPSKKAALALDKYKLKAPIHIIPSAIKPEKYEKNITDEEFKKLRAELGIAEDKTVLLYLGRLGSEKNISELIVFFSFEAMNNDNVVLLIVGDGPERDKLELLAKDCVNDFSIRNNIIFTGEIAPERVYQYYQVSNIFVCASTSESQGLTYIEAMANGLPLLCHTDSCLDGVLFDKGNGIRYEYWEDFSKALKEMLTNPTWRMRSKTIREFTINQFSCDNFGNHIIETYDSLLRDGGQDVNEKGEGDFT